MKWLTSSDRDSATNPRSVDPRLDRARLIGGFQRTPCVVCFILCQIWLCPVNSMLAQFTRLGRSRDRFSSSSTRSMRSQEEKGLEGEGALPRREIQGPRPAPLRICRPSHGIRKPVIIYTHSPKIIHTEAQHFMTLVQRLTGSSDTRSRTGKPKCNEIRTGDDDLGLNNNSSSSSSSLSSAALNRSPATEVSAISGGPGAPASPNSLQPSPNYGGLLSPSIFQDLPPFAPNSDNFFYSPRHFYRFSEPIFTPPQRPPHSSLDLYKSLP